MKILVVDDDKFYRRILTEALLEKGHEIVTAENGVEATKQLFSNSVRMVITDWVMPEMDGPALCRWIRAQMFPGYTYIIMLTSRNGKSDVIEGLKSGADEFLMKPFDPVELETRIRVAERILSAEHHYMVIFALAKLAESRDPETGRHLDRIREYSRLLGNALALTSELSGGLSRADIESIYLTSPLHDIGKVGIPDAILLKPGSLEPAEFEIMKTHTIIGGTTLGQALAQYPGAQFLKTARDIAFWHHERYDGSGYPHGLAGDDIPVSARIVALADVYDALTSKRPYKKAFSHEEARSYILDQRGKQFDPAVVDCYRQADTIFSEISKRLSDSEPRADAAPAPEAALAR
jgi:putative two-component system response regulator